MHTIGNLTLATSSLNSSVSNGPWDDKRAALLQHSRLALNAGLPVGWDSEAITARGRFLAQAFLARWPKPDNGVPVPSAVTPNAEPSTNADVVATHAAQRPTARKPVDGRSVVRNRRGNGAVPQHIAEVFAALPIGTILRVNDVVAAGSSLYQPGEISGGAISACMEGAGVPGVRLLAEAKPRALEKVQPIRQ